MEDKRRWRVERKHGQIESLNENVVVGWRGGRERKRQGGGKGNGRELLQPPHHLVLVLGVQDVGKNGESGVVY